MLKYIQKLFGYNSELAKRRQSSLAKVKSFGYFVYESGSKCHLCSEETYKMYSLMVVASPAGEHFTKYDQTIGYLCPRCTLIGHWWDVSDAIPLSEWDGKKIKYELPPVR